MSYLFDYWQCFVKGLQPSEEIVMFLDLNGIPVIFTPGQPQIAWLGACLESCEHGNLRVQTEIC